MDSYKQSAGTRGRAIRAVTLGAITLMLGLTRTAAAQVVPFPNLTSFLYTSTFICGTAEPTRDVQSSGDAFLSPYDDLEPGSYSTLLSVQNTGPAPRNVSFFVSAQGLPDALFIETLSLGPFESRRFGCLNFMDEVRNNWPTTLLFGQAIQGSVYFLQSNDAIELVTTQTYSATRADGDSGVGGVSVHVARGTPRDLGRAVFLPIPFSP